MSTEKKRETSSNTTDMSQRVWRWGIMGTGRIANDYCLCLNHMPHTTITAVGSRDESKAKKFASNFCIPKAYGSYKGVAQDPQVDIVYVSVVHPMHEKLTLMCLENGKHVVCEKPFTLNSDEAARVIKKARESGLFCMEGMWSRFWPSMKKIRELLNQGAIGTIKGVHTDFGVKASGEVKRYWDPSLGAGATLDIGVYAVAFASMVLGRPNKSNSSGDKQTSTNKSSPTSGSKQYNIVGPSKISALADLNEKGFDNHITIGLKYGDKDEAALCSLTCSTLFRTSGEAYIFGTNGQIKLHGPNFQTATKITLSIEGKDDQDFEWPMPKVKGEFEFSHSPGFVYQIEEVYKCLEAGLHEHDDMPLEESLVIMKTLDEIHSQAGVKYPKE